MEKVPLSPSSILFLYHVMQAECIIMLRLAMIRNHWFVHVQVPGGFKPLLMPVGGTVGANIDGSKVMHKNGHIIIHVSIARRRETDRETDMRTQVRVYDLT